MVAPFGGLRKSEMPTSFQPWHHKPVTCGCSRPVRIQLIWKKNRDLLAQSIQDSPNGTDSQYTYRLNSVHCGPIDAASQLTARESYSFIMKMITRKDVPQYTLISVLYCSVFIPPERLNPRHCNFNIDMQFPRSDWSRAGVMNRTCTGIPGNSDRN